MRVIVDSLVWLDTNELSEHNLKNLRNVLTVFPTKTTDIGNKKDPDPIYLYKERQEERLFGVPRAFYLEIKKQSHEEILRVSYGNPMQPLETSYRSTGPYEEQEDAIRKFLSLTEESKWGGFILKAGCAWGKALANGQPVLTDSGYVPIESVEVGNMVAGTDGKFYPVTGVFPQGERDLYRVLFNDGTSVVCDGDHLWTFDLRSQKWKTVTMRTSELVGINLRVDSGNEFWLPRLSPIEYDEKELPVDPYTFGVLLSLGAISADFKADGDVVYTGEMNREIYHWLRLPKNSESMVSGNANRTRQDIVPTEIKLPSGYPNGDFAASILDIIGISTIHTRLNFLSGVFDAMGEIANGGVVDYRTNSIHLADAIRHIVSSLGGTCYTKIRRMQHSDEIEDSEIDLWLTAYRLTVKLPRDINPFLIRSKSHAYACVKKHIGIGRSVKSVEAVGKGEATCISVDSPDRLFLTRNCIPTHNTIASLEFARRLGLTTLVLVHKEFFMDQWRERILGLMPDARIGLVQQNTCDIENKDFVLAMIQSLSKDTGDKYPKNLYDSTFGLLISDEVHRVSASTWSTVIPRFNAAWRIGLSVGPDSVIELRGGMFGDGWVGRIEDACDQVFCLAGVDKVDGHWVANVEDDGIESRGWQNDRFCWKRVQSFISHDCDRSTRIIRAGSAMLVATDDHSVYRIEPGESVSVNHSKRYKARIIDVPSCALTVKDTLIMDDGAGWSDGKEELFDVLNCVAQSGLNKCHVCVDLSGVSREEFGFSSGDFYRYKNGAYGNFLPLGVFLSFMDRLPEPTFVYTEGASGVRTKVKLNLCDMAWVFGFWIGNGWVNGNRVCVSVHEDMADFVFDKFNNIDGVLWNVVSRKMPSKAVELRCSSKIMSIVFRSIFGDVKAPTKHIPSSWIVSWGESSRRDLLDGLVASDGSRSNRDRNRKRTYYTTVSKKLCGDVCSLLRSLGVVSGMDVRGPGPGGEINGRRIIGNYDRYTVHWSSYAEIGENDGCYGNRKKYIHDGLSLNEASIRSVEQCDSPERVYDLEMDGHPSFVADGLLVHNSATPRRRDGAQDVFFKHIGPIKYNATTVPLVPNLRRLYTDSVLHPMVIVGKHGTYRLEVDKLNSSHVLTQLSEDQFRSRVIVEDIVRAVRQGRKVMVTSHRLEQLRSMASDLNNMLMLIKLPFDPVIDFYTGDWFTGKKTKMGKPKKRSRKRSDLKRAERANVIFSTVQMIEEGLDIQAIDVLVMATPLSDCEQAVGRVRRHCFPDVDKGRARCKHLCPWRWEFCQGKPHPIVVDVIDENVSFSMKRLNYRKKFYKSIGIAQP